MVCASNCTRYTAYFWAQWLDSSWNEKMLTGAYVYLCAGLKWAGINQVWTWTKVKNKCDRNCLWLLVPASTRRWFMMPHNGTIYTIHMHTGRPNHRSVCDMVSMLNFWIYEDGVDWCNLHEMVDLREYFSWGHKELDYCTLKIILPVDMFFQKEIN